MTERWHERLATKLKQLGWTKAELARRSGLKYHAVNKMLLGGVDNPRGDALDRMADALGVSKMWLLFGATGEHTTSIGVETTRRIPFVPLSEVNAMGAVGSIDESHVSVLAPSDVPATTIATRLGDNSMAPDIGPDDMLLVDIAAAPKPGRTVLAYVVPLGTSVVRRYRVKGLDESGAAVAELVPSNSDFPKITVTDDAVRVLGVVTHHIRQI